MRGFLHSFSSLYGRSASYSPPIGGQSEQCLQYGLIRLQSACRIPTARLKGVTNAALLERMLLRGSLLVGLHANGRSCVGTLQPVAARVTRRVCYVRCSVTWFVGRLLGSGSVHYIWLTPFPSYPLYFFIPLSFVPLPHSYSSAHTAPHGTSPGRRLPLTRHHVHTLAAAAPAGTFSAASLTHK